ncbi:hypothetical protein BDF20DRAFT_814866 [Mycotypha africana]|uniref:uncharacterized protein n=1 Tax=Mycotypha africana TaxID=64632 RepID=UPI00230134AF|nr:uncharacterized protein BDF20DRAFT_814866 [Mycotypha africana]KAI8988280.1 hypothetical protein BDF20DRAFT_814866 [Mycotypha africana]
MAASMMKAIVEHQSVSQILTCIYAFLLAAWLIAMETKSMDIPIYYFRIFTLYRGPGILNLSFGVIYFILSFVPGAPTPRHANENWQNWKEYSAEGLDLERPPTKQDDNNQVKFLLCCCCCLCRLRDTR